MKNMKFLIIILAIKVVRVIIVEDCELGEFYNNGVYS